MEIVNDYVDDEAYFDIYLSEIELTRIKDGDYVIKHVHINGAIYNFGIYKREKGEKDVKDKSGEKGSETS